MRNFPLAALCLLAAASSPAAAQEYGFAQDGLILELESGHDSYVSLKPAVGSMFGSIAVGELNVALFADPMSKLLDAFGGTIQSYDNLGDHTDWLCYTDGMTRTWFLTSERYDTLESSPVDWIVAEPANAASNAKHGCVNNPGAMLTPPDFPTLGTTREELARHFGQPIPANTNRVVYFLQEEIGGGEGYSLVRTAYYRLNGNVVDALSLSQWDSR